MIDLHIHPSLVRFTENQNKVALTATFMNEIIPLLCDQFPRLGNMITTASGDLTPYINFYVNGKNIQSYAPETRLSSNDKVDLVTALVGG